MRRFFVLMSMAVNLGMLCYFKYTNLLLGTIADFTREPFEPLDIVLPIGISFFTFRSLSYIIDVYRRQMSPVTSLRDYVFTSRFPSVGGGSRSSGERLCPSDTPSVGDYTYAVGRRSFSRHVRVD